VYGAARTCLPISASAVTVAGLSPSNGVDEFRFGNVGHADGLLALVFGDMRVVGGLLLRKEGTLLFHMIATRMLAIVLKSA
jgi:hypothetical protein